MTSTSTNGNAYTTTDSTSTTTSTTVAETKYHYITCTPTSQVPPTRDVNNYRRWNNYFLFGEIPM